jgi:regulatory protein
VNARTRKLYASEAELYEYAIRSLGRKMRTVAELKRLMRMRVPEDVGELWIENVIGRLKEQRYLNDTQYATAFTRMRQENQRFGKRRVQQDLMVKGVHADVIAKTLDSSYENINEDELARQFLDRKRIQKPKDEKETARVVRLMVRAGYSTSTIFRVLKAWKLEVDEESLPGGE